MSRKRPTRPTDQITAECVKLLKAGVPLDAVARVVLGAKHDELYRWLMIGSGEDKTFIRIPKPYKHFYDQVTRATAHAEARNAIAVQQGGSRWALEWLKRRAPQRWTAPSDSGYVASTEAEAALIRQIKELHARPYVDPRLRSLPEAEREPAVIVEDVIEVRPGCDRPHTDDETTIDSPRPPAALPEVNKRPVL